MTSVSHGPSAFSWSAVVLAGGRGSRLGGRDKALVVVDGTPLLDRLIDGLHGTASADSQPVAGLPPPQRIIVVGPQRTDRKRPRVIHVREQPAYDGPVAAIAAALPQVTDQWMGLLAVDMPFAVQGLAHLADVCNDQLLDIGEALHTAGQRDVHPTPVQVSNGVVAVDSSGRLSPLAFLRTSAVRERMAGLAASGGVAHRPLRAIYDALGLRLVEFLGERGLLLADVDTQSDLDRMTARSP